MNYSMLIVKTRSTLLLYFFIQKVILSVLETNWKLRIMSQRGRVIDLYKSMLHLGKDWPQGFDYFKVRLKKAFLKNREITDPEQIEKCIKHAEFVKKEIETLYMLKKYRTLKRRYSET